MYQETHSVVDHPLSVSQWFASILLLIWHWCQSQGAESCEKSPVCIFDVVWHNPQSPRDPQWPQIWFDMVWPKNPRTRSFFCSFGVKQKLGHVWARHFAIEVPILHQALESFVSLFRKKRLPEKIQSKTKSFGFITVGRPCLETLPDPTLATFPAHSQVSWWGDGPLQSVPGSERKFELQLLGSSGCHGVTYYTSIKKGWCMGNFKRSSGSWVG